MNQPAYPAGVVTISVALGAVEWEWLTRRAAKQSNTVHVEAGRVLQAAIRNREKAARRDRELIEDIKRRHHQPGRKTR
jgi:hypothetical protein